ncbi:MAG: hypothetical protein AVO35_08965 [Candidatus Aegiribacteria sp. MLS_C]|nr:MAG: hypothetical protein AVO35_08965 [Candidatus Aegiribacteria sp. MLS_C]
MSHERRSGLADFFSQNYGRLVEYVRGRLRDRAYMSGEDIVQDVMLNLLGRPDILAPIADLSAYVFGALRNRIVDIYRGRDEDTISLDSENEHGQSLFDVIPDERFRPESSYHSESLRMMIFRLIRELPEPQMAVIVETEFNRRTFRELSEEWDVPVGTLLARKHRGLNAVRRKLEEVNG